METCYKEIIACKKDIAEPDFDEENPIKVLLDYGVLSKYSKLNSKNSSFEFDFSEAKEKEVLTVRLGTKLVGKIAIVPLDAFELEIFDDLVEVATVEAEALNNLIGMSSQFIDVKRDLQDFVQIIGKDESLIVFTTDGDVISTFDYDLGYPIDEFEVTVKGSVLKKIQGFSQAKVELNTSDDFFLVMKDGPKRLKAVILHTDPPYTYEELQKDVEATVEVKEKGLIRSINWEATEMLEALQSVECSSENGQFSYEFKEGNMLILSSEGLANTSTKTEIMLTSICDMSDFYKLPHDGSIDLFKKISKLNSKDNNAVLVEFEPKKISEEGDIYMDDLHCVGTIGSVNYRISFGVFPSV
jgi:hypothetical protein